MTDLYTVEINRKVVKSSYNTRGKLLGVEEVFVKQVISDLPYSTALMYHNKFGADTPVSLIKQSVAKNFGVTKESHYIDNERVRKSKDRSTLDKVKAPLSARQKAEEKTIISTSASFENAINKAIN